MLRMYCTNRTIGHLHDMHSCCIQHNAFNNFSALWSTTCQAAAALQQGTL